MTPRTAAAALVAGAAVLPPSAASSLPVVCLFRRVTGRPCPSCGLTRSWSATAHGNLGDAFRLHPFGPVTYFATLIVAVVGPEVLDRPALRSRPVIAAATGAWTIVWLLRLVRRSAV